MPLASHGLSFVRISLYAGLTLIAIPIQLACLALGPGPASWFPPHYHRLVLRVFGIRVTVRGTLPERGPALVVSNHISYLDIEVLSALMRVSFIAKQDVARWPVFGMLAKLQRSIFVERVRRQRAGEQRDVIVDRLAAGDILVLFPEGTSSDGNRVVPFKSALFSVAETRPGAAPVPVQPVSIAYVRLNGMPIGRTMRPFLAWYGDMQLADHLWAMTALGETEVVVEFHAPVSAEQFGSRKRLAEHCRRVIAAGLEAANAGRDRPPEPEPTPVQPAAEQAPLPA
ncbi:MAG TPA: lysophospholipid acyltransferase family protein [Stellaceae bacterium]|nr:lysophospholipid acyltransferase family protein [Stellaceae bacterium]